MEKIKEILLAIHQAGGCDARDDYSKGYDAGITEALTIVENISGISIECVLD